MSTNLRKFYSINECIGTGLCGRVKLYEAIHKGEIEALKVGKSTRIMAASFDAWVERCRAAADAKFRKAV